MGVINLDRRHKISVYKEGREDGLLIGIIGGISLITIIGTTILSLVVSSKRKKISKLIEIQEETEV